MTDGPWNDYAPQQAAPASADGPWSDYAAPASAPAPSSTANLIPAGMGQPGLSSDPLAGLMPPFLQGGLSPPAPAPGTAKPWSGSILPVSGDANGNVGFDSNAGLLGTIKRAVTLPGDVAKGQVDPLSQGAITRSAELAGLASPINPGVRAGDLAIPGMARATPIAPTPPTADALRAAAGAGYDRAAATGTEYASPAVASVAQGVQSDLNDRGILSVLAPKTHAILNDLQAVPAGDSTVPFGNLDAARKAFGHAARDFSNPTEQLAAKSAQNAIDGFVTAPPPGGIVAGDASAASDAIKDARGNYAAAMRSDKLNGIEDAASLRAAAANSGANTGNSIRQRVASLLLNPKQSAGFNPDEIAALNEVVQGSPTRNAARIAGNLLGGGGGMHGGISSIVGATIGEHLGGPAGAALGVATPLVGFAAKHLDNSLTSGSLGKADDLVRSRSPLADALNASTPPVFADPTRRAALARALLGSQPAPSWRPGQAWNPNNPNAGGSI